MIVNEVQNDGKDGWFNLSHVKSGVLFSNDFVKSAKTTTKSGVKMIFNVVVCSKLL